MANKGTLFLDEIGNLDYEVQGYLLRALQERKIKRVGGIEEIPVSVRILVASNESLAQAVKEGKFREDLYHRLNEFEIHIPALRERIEDLPAFIRHFIAEANTDLQKSIPGVAENCLQFLLDYDWPGNIRELRNVLRKACLLTEDYGYISKKSLPVEVLLNFRALAPEDASLLHPAEENLDAEHNSKPGIIGPKEIEDALRKVNFNKTKAALILKIDRKTLYNKLKLFAL